MKQVATAPVLVLVLGVAAAPAMAEDKRCHRPAGCADSAPAAR